MKPIYDLLSRFWVLVPVKLGRCPYCMRAAARGTAVGLTTAAMLYLLWPGSIPLKMAVVVTVGFTALLCAHMVAYTRRVVPLILRDKGWSSQHQTDRGRRHLLSASVKLGIGAVAMALLGFGRSALGAPDDKDKACPGRRKLKKNAKIKAVGEKENIAKRRLEAAAKKRCNEFCEGRDCKKGTCKQFLRAGKAGEPKFEIVERINGPTSVTLIGKVISCHCECDKDDSDSTISATTAIPVSQSAFIDSPPATGSLFGTVVADVTLNADLNSLQIDLDFTAVEVHLFGGTFLGSDIIQHTQSLPSLPAFFGVTTPVQFLGDEGIIGATANVEGTVEPDGAITEGAIGFFDFTFISA